MKLIRESVVKRNLLYFKNKILISMLVIIFSSLLGFMLGVSACYLSAQEMYMNGINRSFPAKILLFSKDGVSNISSIIDVNKFSQSFPEVVNVTVWNDHAELILKNHKNTNEIANNLNVALINELGKDTNLVFGNATEYNYEQLLKSIEISRKYQQSIILALLCCAIVGFFILNMNSINVFGQDAHILKRIGETNKNIARQLCIYQIITATIPSAIFAGIGLCFSGMISDIWLNSATIDFKEGSSLMMFDNERSVLELLSNDNLFMYIVLLTLVVVVINVVLLILGRIYCKSYDN